MDGMAGDSLTTLSLLSAFVSPGQIEFFQLWEDRRVTWSKNKAHSILWFVLLGVLSGMSMFEILVLLWSQFPVAFNKI